MYGKHFDSMYEGSMVGAGPTVFAVWGYCICKADPETHTVLLNPKLLCNIIGTDEEDIIAAIDFLAKPDPESRNTDHEGRRLLLESGFEYHVVSHDYYRSISDKAALREYHREMKRKQREKRQCPKTVPDNPKCLGHSVSVYDKEKGDSKGEKEQVPPPRSRDTNLYGELQRVKLTPDEHAKLLAKHGHRKLDIAIDVLDAYIASKNKRYANHYAVLKEGSWVWDRVAERLRNSNDPKARYSYTGG